MLYRKSQSGFKGQKQKKATHPLDGQEFTGKVRDVSTAGMATLEHHSGIIVMVRGAWLDEIITVKIVECKKRFAFAELLEIVKPSPNRIIPTCAHAASVPSCGGCMWQFIDYPSQIAMKQKWVEHAFSKICSTVTQTILGSADVWQYRNRVELKSDGYKLGFLATQSNTLIDVVDCSIMNEKLKALHRELRSQLPNTLWSQQDNKTSKQRPTTLIAIDDDLALEDLTLNVRRPFKQANTVQNFQLQEWLTIALEGVGAKGPLLELFCGSGNFTKVLTESPLSFSSITAVEASEDAIAQLQSMELKRVQGICADLYRDDVLSDICENNSRVSTLVLDPPRSGLLCIEPILKLKSLEVIAYISCDLASCIRDVTAFVRRGFTVQIIQPVDMFPHTPHVEICVLLSRKACGKA